MKTKLKLLLSVILTVCLVMAMVPGSAHAALTYYAGQDIGAEYVYFTDGDVWDVYCIGGSLPSGMGVSLDYSGYAVILYGTPYYSGTYYASFCVSDMYGDEYFDLVITVLDPYAPDPQPQPAYNPPTLTKSPTSETVQAGGSATFVSRAKNYSGITWYLCRSDYGAAIEASSIGAYFEGAWASGCYSETLTIGNLPKSFNGWYVQCYFANSYGGVYSDAVPVYVTSPKPAPTPAPKPAPTAAPAPTQAPVPTDTPLAVRAQLPNISAQPEDVVAEQGKPAVLSVAASAPDGGTLSYQWFKSESKDSGSMVAINGATSSSYTPNQAESTLYYCVEITNTKDDSTQVTRSKIVSVKKVEPKPAETPAASAVTATSAPVAANPNSANVPVFLYGIIAVLGVAVIALIIVLSKRKQ